MTYKLASRETGRIFTDGPILFVHDCVLLYVIVCCFVKLCLTNTVYTHCSIPKYLGFRFSLGKVILLWNNVIVALAEEMWSISPRRGVGTTSWLIRNRRTVVECGFVDKTLMNSIKPQVRQFASEQSANQSTSHLISWPDIPLSLVWIAVAGILPLLPSTVSNIRNDLYGRGRTIIFTR